MKPHLNLELHKVAKSVVAPPAPTPKPESGSIERLAYSITQAAEASSLSRSTLYAAMEEGRLHFVKIKGRRLILADALRSFLKGEVA